MLTSVADLLPASEDIRLDFELCRVVVMELTESVKSNFDVIGNPATSVDELFLAIKSKSTVKNRSMITLHHARNYGPAKSRWIFIVLALCIKMSLLETRALYSKERCKDLERQIDMRSRAM